MRGVRTGIGWRRLGVVAIALGLLATSACGGGSSSESVAGTFRAVKPSPPTPATTLSIASPGNGASEVLTSAALTFTTNAALSSVTLMGPDGKPVAGTLSGKSWLPGVQLKYSSTYKVTAKAGKATLNTSFSTMAKPSSITGADLYVTDGQMVGVGLPIVVEFTRNIPQAQRAAVERRLLVTSTPAVEGAWHWYSGGEVHYRPKNYWPVGTKISIRLAIGGFPMGNGHYGKRDRFANVTVGRSLISKVYNKDKTMYVYEAGKLIRKFPISLGASATPSSSGNLVAMQRASEMIFDSSTFGVPADAPGGYREKVYWDVRYTWGGEFVHAAPWSVGSQGYRNVSHGCVNAAPSNAEWFYNATLIGDPIQIYGTGTRVKPGDGWTDWELSWPKFVAGSALHA
jgi:lipoprotein-anchoring transpeptidase ErfK/SrfK